MLPVHMRKFSKLACHMLPISHLLPLFLAILPHRNELLAFRELCALARTSVIGAKCTRQKQQQRQHAILPHAMEYATVACNTVHSESCSKLCR